MKPITSTAGAISVLAAVLLSIGSVSCGSSETATRSEPDTSTAGSPTDPVTSSSAAPADGATTTETTDTVDSTDSEPPDAQLRDSTPGPYAVGHTMLELPAESDTSALVVDVWYPSDGTPGPLARYDLIPGVIGVESSRAVDAVPPADGRFPIVVYSHGSGAFRFIATFFTEILASHGYVVAAVDHPGDTIVDAFIRGGGPADLEQASRARVGDLERVIDALVAGPSALTDSVDDGNIVLAGHSLGGVGVIATAVVDDRIDAIIAMDPTWSLLDSSERAAVDIPMLTIWGTAGESDGSHRTESVHGGPWYRVDLEAAPHGGFSDACAYAPLVPGWLAAGAPAEIEAYMNDVFADTCSPEFMAPQRLHDLVLGYSLAFLDRVLDDDPDADALLRSAQPDATLVAGGQ
jgi:dienelactone hydrolase